MTSKHYRWQTRWTIDVAAREARHECGLVVRFSAIPAGGSCVAHSAQALNAEPVRAALAEKHGHNATAMIERMLREALELYRHERTCR